MGHSSVRLVNTVEPLGLTVCHCRLQRALLLPGTMFHELMAPGSCYRPRRDVEQAAIMLPNWRNSYIRCGKPTTSLNALLNPIQGSIEPKSQRSEVLYITILNRRSRTERERSPLVQNGDCVAAEEEVTDAPLNPLQMIPV